MKQMTQTGQGAQLLSKFFRQYATLFVLIVIIAVFSFMHPAFFTVTNMMNILRQISMMTIVTVGVSFVLISGGLDLSVGSQIALMNCVVALMITSLGVNPILAILAGLALTTGIGLFNGFTISKTGIPPLIATLAMMTSLRGITFIITRGFPVHGLPDSLRFIGQGILFGVLPVPVVIMLVIIVAGAIFLNKTYIGRHFYALGSNTEATRLSGINVHFTRILSYTLLGFLTGLAGLIMLFRVGSGQPNIADGMELEVLTAAVLGGVSVKGGKGSISGAVIGAVIIGVLNNGLVIIGAGTHWQRVITGTILFAVIVFDSLSQSRGRTRKTA